MKFARMVFLIAGIWGIAVLTPLYWLRDITGRAYTTPTESPQFFYGFFAVALTWQLAFLAIAWNPIRLRPFMILGVIEDQLRPHARASLPAGPDPQRRRHGRNPGSVARCLVRRCVCQDESGWGSE